MSQERRPGLGCWVWGLAILFIFPALGILAFRFFRYVWEVTTVQEGDTPRHRRWALRARVALIVVYALGAVGLFYFFVTLPDPDTTDTATAPATDAAHECWTYAYDRDSWGDYPKANPNTAPTWTRPSDRVNAPAITQDHHVSLHDAHDSGGCLWSAARKQAFASDPENLNPTTSSFNSSKGSRTPDRLTGIAADIIDTDWEKCDYAFQHGQIKLKYGLSLTPREEAVTLRWLALCEGL